MVGRTVFEFSFGEKSFWGTIRSRKIGPFSISWYQVLGFPEEFLTNRNDLMTSFREQL